MRKCLIVPYFGQFPNYFQLTLNSCGKNPDFDWLLFTDNREQYKYPKNVKVIQMGFNDFKNLIQNKFEFKISLEKPYKLCDYKPAYGYILAQYLKDYDWWGYCDIDVIFGRLSKFVTEEMLLKYKKIFVFGHMTLMKNEKEVNEMFKRTLNGKELYKEVFQTEESCFFDETWGGNKTINNIFESQGFSIFSTNYSADIYPNKAEFICIESDMKNRKIRREKWKQNFFVYDYGKVLRYYLDNGKITEKEYMYLHLQKRKMQIDDLVDNNKYKIIPNLFTNLEYSIINEDSFKKIKYRNLDKEYALLKLKHNYISKRFRVLLNSLKKRFK